MTHDEVTKRLKSIYEYKDKRYGNSFNLTYDLIGPSSMAGRLLDKSIRIANIVKGLEDNESLEDNLMDIANYAILGVMKLRSNEENGKS